jgi:hypothetical protein
MKKVSNLIHLCNKACNGDITSTSRDRNLVYGRAVFYVMSKKLHRNISLQRLGDLTNRDHATVLFSLRRSKDVYPQDPMYVAIYNVVLKKVDGCPSDYDVSRDEKLLKMPVDIAKYVQTLYTEIDSLKMAKEHLEDTIEKTKEKFAEDNRLLGDVLEIPREHRDEFMEYRLRPFIKMIKARKNYESRKLNEQQPA